MAITSKRETITAYIKATTLPLINGTGHYNNNIKTIAIPVSPACFFEIFVGKIPFLSVFSSDIN